jgi:superfamily II DNA or RNA helicase
MEVRVKNDIVIKDYSLWVYQWVTHNLSFPNPEYYKKQERGLWTGNTPREIVLYERRGNDLVVPFGMLPYIFKNKLMFNNITNCLKQPLKQFDYRSNIKPYDYQERAIESALKAKQGVIVAPCGSGKTQIGLEIAARLGMRTLWLTHTSDLLRQSMDRAKGVFDLKPEDFGTITAGKINIGNVITFATVQTMSKVKPESYDDQFDVVIVDEAHHVVGTPTQVQMFYKVISSISARYKFGLTATPKRSDGLTPCMYALIGEKICEIDKKEVADTTCDVCVSFRDTGFEPDIDKILMPDGTLSFTKLIKEITNDSIRNDFISYDVACIAKGHTCLVLTDRVEHVKTLVKLISEKGVSVSPLYAKASKKDKYARENALSQLSRKEIQVVVATFALAREGLDVPSLDCVVFATPQKNEAVVLQSAGRVCRKSDGKKCGYVFDYVDNFPMLVKWFKKRCSMYNRAGFSFLSGDYKSALKKY